MIVNPASANGRTARQWPEIARRGRVAHGLDVDVRATEAPRARHRAGRRRPTRGRGAGGGGRRRRHRLGGRERADGGRRAPARPGRGAPRLGVRLDPHASASPRTATGRWRSPPAATPPPSTSAASSTPVTTDGRRPATSPTSPARHDRGRRRPGQPVGQAAGSHRRLRLGGDRHVRRLPQLAVSRGDRRTAHRPGLQQRDRRQLPLLRRRHEDPADGRSRRRPAGRAGVGGRVEARPGPQPAPALPRHARRPPQGAHPSAPAE